MEADIPDKLFFRIGEVARIASLRPSILRYWESEFSELKPLKSSKGQRLYSRREVDVVLDIKRLLYSEKLTIKGARRALANREKNKTGVEDEGPSNEELLSLITEVKNDLLKIRDLL
jgi:DNA-binding transcriptional MerR regulator